MRRLVPLLSALAFGVAWAQGAELPDAGLPDASVGEAGAERASEEQEQGADAPCVSAADCDRGFACVEGRCTWQRARDATFLGCGSGGLAAAAVGLLAVRRQRLANLTK